MICYDMIWYDRATYEPILSSFASIFVALYSVTESKFQHAQYEKLTIVRETVLCFSNVLNGSSIQYDNRYQWRRFESR